MTPLQFEIMYTLADSKIPALTAAEIATIMKVAIGTVGGSLSSMKAKTNLQNLKMHRSDGKEVMVPGIVIGIRGGGMYKVVEKKTHWYLTGRKKEVYELRVERNNKFGGIL